MGFIAGRFFLLIQIVFFVFLVIAIYFYRKSMKENSSGEGAYLWKGKTPIPRGSFEAKSGNAFRSSILTTTFPNWNEYTSDEEILNLKPGSSKREIENAFKKIMKRYHPDRFANDGEEYQRRAHEIVLLAQKAKDRMMKLSS